MARESQWPRSTQRNSLTGPNLAQVELVTVSLVQGTAIYTLSANIVTLLDAYFDIYGRRLDVRSVYVRISRTEYAAIPVKTTQGDTRTGWIIAVRVVSMRSVAALANGRVKAVPAPGKEAWLRTEIAIRSARAED